jgi:hypothetical protein
MVSEELAIRCSKIWWPVGQQVLAAARLAPLASLSVHLNANRAIRRTTPER